MFANKGFMIAILVIILVLLIGIGIEFSKNSEETYDNLPALNYYTLDAPNYFFYDPIITNDSGTGKKNFRSQTNGLPGMDTVFGPNNYLRYEVIDIDLELPEPPNNDNFS
jgi:hypothetical protein